MHLILQNLIANGLLLINMTYFVKYVYQISMCSSKTSISKSSIGRPFRSPLWRWRKMAALPLPAAILDDLIPSFRVREWGHPRWRPEAEGPPSCATATMGIEKAAPSPGWRHFRRRHLESKMAAPQVTSGGPRNSREILRKVWSYQKNVP